MPLLALAMVLVLPAVASAADDAVVLQYKFEKGKPLVYKLVMKSKAIFKTPDGNQRTTMMKTSMIIRQELIEKKPDGSYRVSITVEKGVQEVDGKKAPLPPIPPSIVTILPNGEIKAATSASANQTQQLQMIFPQKPLKEGDTWVQSQNIDNPIPLTTKTLYKIAQINARYPGYPNRTVLIKSKMKLENAKTATNESVSSQTMGNLWFDPEKGCIVRSKAHSSFKFDLPINLPELLPEGSKVKVEMKLEVEIRLINKK